MEIQTQVDSFVGRLYLIIDNRTPKRYFFRLPQITNVANLAYLVLRLLAIYSNH
jgi:hypothetical protein